MQDTVNGIEIREQEYREAEGERDKRISSNERMERMTFERRKAVISHPFLVN